MNNFLRVYTYTHKKNGDPYPKPYSMIYAKNERDANRIEDAMKLAGYKTKVRLSHGQQWHVDVWWS